MITDDHFIHFYLLCFFRILDLASRIGRRTPTSHRCRRNCGQRSAKVGMHRHEFCIAHACKGLYFRRAGFQPCCIGRYMQDPTIHRALCNLHNLTAQSLRVLPLPCAQCMHAYSVLRSASATRVRATERASTGASSSSDICACKPRAH